MRCRPVHRCLSLGTRNHQRIFALLHQTVVLKDERTRPASDRAGEALDGNVSGRVLRRRAGHGHLILGLADHVSSEFFVDHAPVEPDAVLLQNRRLGISAIVEYYTSGGIKISYGCMPSAGSMRNVDEWIRQRTAAGRGDARYLFAVSRPSMRTGDASLGLAVNHLTSPF